MSQPKPLSRKDARVCEQLLEQAEMFSKVPPHLRKVLVKQFKKRELSHNEQLLKQGEPSDRFFLIESGNIHRTNVDPEHGKTRTVEFAIKAASINSMRVLSGDPVFTTTRCASEHCRVYEMLRENFLETLKENPDITVAIAEGLCEEIRTGSRKYVTPLLEQQQQGVNVPAVAIASGIEAYYRSALNAMLNARLTGVKADLFPNMHIQVPMRIGYITGFKGLRSFFDSHIDPESYKYPDAVRLGMAFSPGVIMTPISSVLEASNAGHLNKEPMRTRWMRGVVPRAGREIIFGLGLNQMSDYFEERLGPVMPPGHAMMTNAAGSLAAGVVSGYLSHVPHNLSTLKLMEPQKSYSELYKQFVNKSVPPAVDTMVKDWPATARDVTRTVFATLFPRGVMIRTTQIVGSFIILNGTINYLQLKEHDKIRGAIGVVGL